MKKSLKITIATMLIVLSLVTGISPIAASADNGTISTSINNPETTSSSEPSVDSDTTDSLKPAEEPETTDSSEPVVEPETTEPSESAEEPETTEPSESAEEPETTEPSESAEEPETTDSSEPVVETETTDSTEPAVKQETTEQPELQVPADSTEEEVIEASVIPEDGEEVEYIITSEGPMGDFIANYLSPYFGQPAVIKKEKGKMYAYITLSGKAYGFTEIQVVKEDETKEDVEILGTVGEGMNQVRVIKFALDGTTTNLFVNSDSYGHYTLKLLFDLEEEETPAEPEVKESEVETTWYYKGEVFNVGRFLNTTVTLKEVSGEKSIVIDNISSIITEFKMNGESLTVENGKAEFKVEDLSDATATIGYKAGERAMSHDFTVSFKSESEPPSEPEVKESKIETTWLYKEKTFDVSKFLNTTATLKEVNGEKSIVIDSISTIITDFKINGESLTVKNGTAEFKVEDLSDVTATIAYKAGERAMSHDFTVSLKLKDTTPEPPTDSGQEVSYKITSEGPSGDFIANYLSPYFGQPASVKTENGTKYAYITLSGKAYGFTQIQVVNEDGTKNDVEVASSVGEGMNQVRVIKFALNGTTTDLYVNGGEYGEYTIKLNFDLEEVGTPTTPEKPTTPTKPTTPVKDPEQLEDGDYTIEYEFLTDDTNESSIMNQYVYEVANLTVKNGKNYVSIKIFNSSLITGFKVDSVNPKVISTDREADSKIVEFEVSDLSERVDAWVKVDYSEINYHHEYEMQIKFNVKSIEEASSKNDLESVVKNPVPPEKLPEKPVTPETPKVDLKEGQFYNTELIFGEANAVVKEYLGNKVGIRVEGGKFKVTLVLKNSAQIQSVQVKNDEGNFVEAETTKNDTVNNTREVEFEANDLTKKIQARIAINSDAVKAANDNDQYTEFEFSLNTAAIQEGIINTEQPVLSESVNGLKDGEYTIGYDFLTDGTDTPSIMNTYVDKTATLKVVNGEQFILLTLLNSSWVTGFKVEQNGALAEPTVISFDQASDRKVVQFKVEDLEKKLNVWVKVDVAHINYHHDYNLQLVFYKDSINVVDNPSVETELNQVEEGTQTDIKENPVNVDNKETTENLSTDVDGSSNDSSDSAAANLSFDRGNGNGTGTDSGTDTGSNTAGTNPKTSDLTELSIYIAIFIGSLLLLARRYRMHSRTAR